MQFCADVTENPPPLNETYHKIHAITAILLWKNTRKTKQDGKSYKGPMSAYWESS
jgi:hypothetical protein